MPEFPEALKYSSEHEWVRDGNGASVRIGITDYAAQQLGDIVFVSLPSAGDEVGIGDSVGELESTKSVSELFCPVAGVVAQINDQVIDNPEIVNSDPYGEGWLFEVEIADDSGLDDLMDADTYAAEVGS